VRASQIFLRVAAFSFFLLLGLIRAPSDAAALIVSTLNFNEPFSRMYFPHLGRFRIAELAATVEAGLIRILDRGLLVVDYSLFKKARSHAIGKTARLRTMLP
jgi:hypothetical protein